MDSGLVLVLAPAGIAAIATAAVMWRRARRPPAPDEHRIEEE